MARTSGRGWGGFWSPGRWIFIATALDDIALLIAVAATTPGAGPVRETELSARSWEVNLMADLQNSGFLFGPGRWIFIAVILIILLFFFAIVAVRPIW